MARSPGPILCTLPLAGVCLLLVWAWSQPAVEVHAALSARPLPSAHVELEELPSRAGPGAALPSLPPARLVPGSSPLSAPTKNSAPSLALLQIRVLDSEGATVAGARVFARQGAGSGPRRSQGVSSGSEGTLDRGATSDASGLVSLLLPPGERTSLTVIGPIPGELATATAEGLTAGRTSTLRIVLPRIPLGPIPCEALDEQGHPLPDACLSLLAGWAPGAALNLAARPAPNSKHQGKSLLTAPARGPAFLLARSARRAPRLSEQGSARSSTPKQVVLAEAGRLALQVRPRSLVTVRFPLSALLAGLTGEGSFVQRADAKGWLELDELPAGVELQLAIDPPCQGAPTRLTLLPGEVRNFRLGSEPRGPSLTGVLQDGSGRNLAGVELWCVPAAQPGTVLLAQAVEPSARIITAADGSFEIENLARTAWWIAPAPGQGFAPKAHWFEIGPTGGEIRLLLQAEGERKLEFRVQDEQGLPRAGIVVRVLNPSGRCLAEGRSGRDGALILPGLPDIPLRVRAFLEDTSCVAQALVASSGPTLIVVPSERAQQVLILEEEGVLACEPLVVSLRDGHGAEAKLRSRDGVVALPASLHGPATVGVVTAGGRRGLARIEGEQGGPVRLTLTETMTALVRNQRGLPLEWRIRSADLTLAEGRLLPGQTREVLLPQTNMEVEVRAPGADQWSAAGPLTAGGEVDLPLPWGH